MRYRLLRGAMYASLLFASSFTTLYSAEPTILGDPRPTPVTRPEMKRLLEDMKTRTPRIPLPPLSPEEQAKAEQDPRSFGYEGRVRSLYVPEGDIRGYLNFSGSPRGGFPGGNRPGFEPDPALTLEYKFKTQLFWIAARANNCQYCLGHQESKLLATGMTENELAALDCDWSRFTPAEQAAFALARRLTLEPHLLSDADVERCKEFFTEPQIIEMSVSVAGNNAINRWKEGLGVPQSTNGGNFGGRQGGPPSPEIGANGEHSYLTPTSDDFAKTPSVVVALWDEPNDGLTAPTRIKRPKLEPFEATLAKLSEAAARSPRLPVADEKTTAEVMAELSFKDKPPQWVRLLAQFPIAGKRTVASIESAEKLPALSQELKAQIAWSVARQDRAWYAMGQANARMNSLGMSKSAIAALDRAPGERGLSESDDALLTVALNLAASPIVLTDAEVAKAVELAGPEAVVQTVTYTTFRAMFDRFTEAAGLPID